MKRRTLLATLATAPGLVAAAAAPGPAVVWPQGVTLLDGSPWRPQPGQAQIVVFWATTCPYCKRHNQHVEKLHRALAGRGAAVLGVARDRDPEAVRRHLAAQGLSFPVTLAAREFAAALSPRNLIPLTITVDRLGRLREVIPGEMFEEDVMELMSLTRL